MGKLGLIWGFVASWARWGQLWCAGCSVSQMIGVLVVGLVGWWSLALWRVFLGGWSGGKIQRPFLFFFFFFFDQQSQVPYSCFCCMSRSTTAMLYCNSGAATCFHVILRFLRTRRGLALICLVFAWSLKGVFHVLCSVGWPVFVAWLGYFIAFWGIWQCVCWGCLLSGLLCWGFLSLPWLPCQAFFLHYCVSRGRHWMTWGPWGFWHGRMWYSDFKAVSAIFYQIFMFSLNDSPSNTVKNAFYFI